MQGASVASAAAAKQDIGCLKRVVVLDADDAFVDQIVTKLTKAGWDVVPFELGCDVNISRLDARNFIVDICPEGVPRVERITDIHRSVPSARVMAVTSYPSLALAVAAVKAGAADCFAKPLDPNELFALLEGSVIRDTNSRITSLPTLAKIQWDYIARVLHRSGGNISETARILGIQRSTLQRKLKKYPPRW
jgi:two-component system, response regulator RegA